MSIRILVAEDEENIRLAIKTIARKNLPCDEVVTCENGQDAWDKLQQDQYSLVISDWNMPHKTGYELLEAMRGDARTRNVPMLLLTARSDKSSVINALQAGVSDYLTKPFDKEALVQKATKLLAKAMAASWQDAPASDAQNTPSISIADELMDRLHNGENALPVLPELAQKVEALFAKEVVEINELVKVVQNDPGITSKLISISNSPQYRGMSEIKSLDKAIARIGLKMTQNYVLILAKRSLFKVDAPQYAALLSRIWQHSLATAAAAQSLAQKFGLSDPDGYYSMGLLHDIGKLLILQNYAEIAKRRQDASEAQCMDLMEKYHAEIGAELLAKWNFPIIYQQIAASHEDLSKVAQPGSEMLGIALANQIAIQAGYRMHEAQQASLLQTLADQMHVGNTMLEALQQQVKEYMSANSGL